MSSSSSNRPASEPPQDQVRVTSRGFRSSTDPAQYAGMPHPPPRAPRRPLPRHANQRTPRYFQDVVEAQPGGKPNEKKKRRKKQHSGSTKTQDDEPVLWVDLLRCFLCGKEGRSPPLRKCTQCEVAYYCGKTCQQDHWKTHKPVCFAAVVSKAQDATRQRLARAVREKGKDKVEGAEDDTLCVICLGPPVAPVVVRAYVLCSCACVCTGGCCVCVCVARARACKCVTRDVGACPCVVAVCGCV